MTMIVTADYAPDTPNPIELAPGDRVRLGDMSDPNGPYPNWIYCESERTGNTGWVAVNILAMEGSAGIAVRDYTAKEMTVATGDIVETVHELNGWFWCVRPRDSEEGWVAADNLRPLGKE